MKISNDKALELLENLPLEKVANESSFLAPLYTTGRQASVLCDDVNFGKRLVAGELGTENIWWEVEYVGEPKKIRLTGTVQDEAKPIKGVQ